MDVLVSSQGLQIMQIMQVESSVNDDPCFRSSEEKIRQQRAESHHLSVAPDAHVPFPPHHTQARKEKHQSVNGETTNLILVCSLKNDFQTVKGEGALSLVMMKTQTF